MPPRETTRSTSTASAGARPAGSGGGPAVTRAVGDQPGQVGDGQVRADGLDPGAADGQVDPVAVGPEPDDLTGPGRAEPELLPAQRHVPRRRHHPVELDRPTRPPAPAGLARRLGVVVGVVGRSAGGRRPASAGSQTAAAPVGCSGPGRTGRAGITGSCWSRRLVRAGRCCSRATHASTAACAASSDGRTGRRRRGIRAEGAVEPLHLPVLVRRRRLGQPVGDPVAAADLVEQHLPAALPNRSVNCLPLSVITSSGTPNRASACGERQTHRPAGGPLHHRGDHAEPGVVIDPGDDLGLPQLPGDRVDQLRPRRRCRCSTAASARAARTGRYESRGRFRGRGRTSPCRIRIRFDRRAPTAPPRRPATAACAAAPSGSASHPTADAPAASPPPPPRPRSGA